MKKKVCVVAFCFLNTGLAGNQWCCGSYSHLGPFFGPLRHTTTQRAKFDIHPNKCSATLQCRRQNFTSIQTSAPPHNNLEGIFFNIHPNKCSVTQLQLRRQNFYIHPNKCSVTQLQLRSQIFYIHPNKCLTTLLQLKRQIF